MCVEDAGRALDLTGHLVDRHGRGGEAMIGLGPASIDARADTSR
jgi:hypothetical protein